MKDSSEPHQLKLTMIGTRYQLRGTKVIWEVISEGKIRLVTDVHGKPARGILEDDYHWPPNEWDKIEPKEDLFTTLYNRLK